MKNYYKFSTVFIVFILFSVLTAVGAVKNNQTAVQGNSVAPVIIIDAGHGGFDGGTSSKDGTLEKDINLKIALMLNDILKLSGYETVCTRTTDTDTADKNCDTIRSKKVSDIHNRLNLVNSYENSVLVSIHQNYFDSSFYNGTQVFYSANNTESRVLAESIRKSVIDNLQKDNQRETKPSGSSIYILYKASKPSVMVECGFLSNDDDTEKLKDDLYCRKLAYSISLGIIEYFKNGNTEV